LDIISKHKSASLGVWISDGGSRLEKIPFLQTVVYIKKFLLRIHSDSPDNISTI